MKQRKIFSRLVLLGLLVSIGFTSCSDRDERVDQLTTDVAALTQKIEEAKSEAIAAATTQINALQAEVDALETKIETLENQLQALAADGVTDAELAAAIAAAKEELLGKLVSIEAFTTYQNTIAGELDKIKADIQTLDETKATKAELEAKIGEVNTKIATIEQTLGKLGGDVENLQTGLSALQTDFANYKSTTDARIAVLESLLGLAQGQSTVLDNIKADLASQLAKINANIDAIAALRADLTTAQGNITTLQGRVTALEGTVGTHTTEIANIKTELTTLGNNITALDTKFSNLIDEINLKISGLNKRLTSLTLVPEFYVNGIEAVNFSPLTSACKAITPGVSAAYNLNPSFITVNDIDVENMTFDLVYTSNMNLAAGAAGAATTKVKAIFDKIDAGKIYVKISVEDYDLLSKAGVIVNGGEGTLEKFYSVALQIPIKDTEGTTTVITSDYVRLFSQNLNAQTDVYLANNRTDTNPKYPKLAQTLAAAKLLPVVDVDGASASDPTVVVLPYGETLDLIDHVTAALNSAQFDLEKYGLKLKFDLKSGALDAPNYLNDKNASDDPAIVYNRGANNTDQQKFIEITDADKGTIKAKVFTANEIAASQGRTPIVRVWAYDTNGSATCPVLLGYVKIHLGDKPVPVIPPVTVDYGSSVLACADFNKTTTVQWTNEEIYNAVGLSKEEFHTIYDLNGGTSDANGTVTEVYNPDGQTTDTWLLKWTLTNAQLWAKLGSGQSVTITKTVTYVPTGLTTLYPDITINFKATFTRPAVLNLSGSQLIANYWYGDYTYVKHNVFVPVANETDPTLAVFYNNLNQAFEQTSDKKLKAMTNAYEYFFYKDASGKNYSFTVNGTTYDLKPSADGQTLLYGSEVIATLHPWNATNGNVLELNKDSETAKLLLNYDKEFLKARIGIRTLYCPGNDELWNTVTINGKQYFDVVFVRPVNPVENSSQYFVDGLNLGDKYTYIDIDSLVNLHDWRSPDAVAYFSTHPTYYQYYDIQSVTVDLTKIKTDLNQTGSAQVLLSTYPDLVVGFESSITGVTPIGTYGYLTYKNNGNVLGKAFNLYVPVTITYTWGEIVSAYVKVPVEKTVGGSGAKRK